MLRFRGEEATLWAASELADGLGFRLCFGFGRELWTVEDDDGFGETVVGALVVGIEEVLQEAEAALKGRGTVTEGALDGLP